MVNKKTEELYFMRGGGEMGELMQAMDWSKTPLGQPQNWSQSLKTMVAVMLENPFGMMIAWGKNYTQLYNDGFRPILGSAKHPQALGISTRQTFEEIYDIVGPMFDDVMQGKSVRATDARYILNRNGFEEECYFDFAYSPIRDDKGGVGGVLVTVIETTGRKKTELDLTESEARFRTLAEGSEMLISVAEPDLRTTYFNKAWADFTGRPVEEMLNFGWERFMHAEDKEILMHKWQKAVEQKEPIVSEFRMLNKEGKYRWLLANIPPRYNNDGTLAGYVSSCIDITERIEGERLLRENEKRFRFFIEEASVPTFLVKGPHMTIEIVNQAMVKVFGKGNDVYGKKFKEIFPEKEAEPFLKQLQDVYTSGEPFFVKEIKIPMTINGKPGSYYFDYNFKPLRDESNEVYAIMCTASNVTEQVLVRKALEEAEQQMRAMVETAPFAIGVYVGRQMKVIFANQTIMDIWGKGNDVIGKPFSDVLPELDNQEVFKQLDEVYNTGKAFHAINQRLDLIVDNKVRPYYFNYSLTPLFDTAGKVYGVMNTGVDLTDLNLAKQKIEQSEKNFRSIILQSPVAMCLLMGENHVVQVANDSMIQLWGKKRDDVINKPLFDSLPETLNQGFDKILSNVLATGITFSAFERPVTLLRNGKEEVVYQNFVYEPYRDADGSILGVLAISIDVTQEALSRQKIEEAEAKTRLAMNSAELGLYEIIYAGDAMITDKRFKEIWGVDEESSRAQYVAAIHPDDIPHRKAAHQASLKSGQLDYVARIIKKDRPLHWVRITGKVIYDEKQVPLKIIGVVQDITETVTAQQKIEKSESNLRQTILQAPVAMCIFKGPNYVVELANERMYELWGKRAEQVLNKPIFEGLPEVKNQGFEALLDGVYKTGKTFTAQGVATQLPRATGIETIYINFVYEAYLEADGSISGVLAVAVDVTDQVIAHQKIEDEVTKRTKELGDANSNLQKSNSELAQFAYIASHDLQEPLRKITTFSQMLEDALDNSINEQAQKYLDKIKTASVKMNTLIRDVLAYSELTRVSDLFTVVDLNEVVQNASADYELLIEQKGASVIWKDLPAIEAIPLQMSQLFGNIIGNALKFTRKDIKPVIEVAAEKATPEEVAACGLDPILQYTKVRFSDNGIGFAPEHADQVFKIFQRLHRKSDYEGTGIGLAMCKKIAINHNGDMNAVGSSDKGAVFNVILPVKHTNK